MKPAPLRVDFFYDVVSPYSFLAFEVLMRYKPIWNMQVRLRPFFLGGVMQATENTPPGSNPVKALYLQKDVQRLSAYFQVPLKHPSQFPVFTLTAMRALTALSMAGDETRVEAFSRALWQKLW
eukprot:TRINITY_DN528_c0_g1_i2.p1 TRINITY_DN528_c0_g1~~TRINITY_DN528_c0_g1_i2.p1  ORF type:complete len:123 (+),score=12.88 TRINITY_DN528_c0_g1_i2:91-459(+)